MRFSTSIGNMLTFKAANILSLKLPVKCQRWSQSWYAGNILGAQVRKSHVSTRSEPSFDDARFSRRSLVTADARNDIDASETVDGPLTSIEDIIVPHVSRMMEGPTRSANMITCMR